MEEVKTTAVNESEEVEFRELDGYFFRVQRNGKWLSVCWSDLTEAEMNEILDSLNDKENVDKEQWMRTLCIGLGRTIRQIGDIFDIRTKDSEEG